MFDVDGYRILRPLLTEQVKDENKLRVVRRFGGQIFD